MPRKITITIPDKKLIPKAAGRISLNAYAAILFRKNELLYTNGEEPWTDEIIRELCRRRFPKSKTVAEWFNTKKASTVGSIRSKFNRGHLANQIDYRYYGFISFRYDAFGNIVEPKRGVRVLTPEDVQDTIRRFQILRRDRGIYVPQEVLELLPPPETTE